MKYKLVILREAGRKAWLSSDAVKPVFDHAQQWEDMNTQFIKKSAERRQLLSNIVERCRVCRREGTIYFETATALARDMEMASHVSSLLYFEAND
jgi:hypothetical protein